MNESQHSSRPAVARNLPLLCAFHGLQMSLFPIAIITLFWKRDIGMTMTQILLMQGVFGLAMAMFEFPSGYLADRIGYRRALLFAALFNIVGWTIYCFADSIPVVVVAEVIMGIGMSLSSGTDNAMMYESLKESGDEEYFAMWNGRYRFWGQTSEGSAALFAGILYATWTRLPFVFETLIWVINLCVVYAMIEPSDRIRGATESHWRQIRSMFRYIFIENRALLAVVIFTIVLGMASFIPVWLVPLYANGAGVPEHWIGPIWAIANYSVALGALSSGRVTSFLGTPKTLLICVFLIGIGYFGMGLTYAFWGFAWYFFLTIMRGVFGPALLHREQRLIPSSDRAGFLSLRSLLFRTTFFVISPFIGAGVDRSGQHTVLLIIGGIITLLAFLGWFAWRATDGRNIDR